MMTAWFQAHWQAILYVTIAVLPSIITGAREYPQVSHWLSVLLDVLSVLQHKDSPGTLKLPFKRSNPPEVCEGPTKPETPTTKQTERTKAFPPAAVLAIIALAGVTGCCAIRGTCREGSAGACVTDTIKSQAPHLLPILADLLAHGVQDIEGSLLSEGITVAPELLRCAVIAVADLANKQLVAVQSGHYEAYNDWRNAPADVLERIRDGAMKWSAAHGGR